MSAFLVLQSPDLQFLWHLASVFVDKRSIVVYVTSSAYWLCENKVSELMVQLCWYCQFDGTGDVNNSLLFASHDIVRFAIVPSGPCTCS